jgi:hypothetical protein
MAIVMEGRCNGGCRELPPCAYVRVRGSKRATVRYLHICAYLVSAFVDEGLELRLRELHLGGNLISEECEAVLNAVH